MVNECNEKYQELLKKAEAIINEHEAFMDTMLVQISGEFIGYQPKLAQGRKKKYAEVKKERLEEIHVAFETAEKFLKKNGVELMLCFVSLKEGGTAILISGDAAHKYRTEIFDKLQEMEKQYNERNN